MKHLLSLIFLLPATIAVGELKSCPKPYEPQKPTRIDQRQAKCLATMIYGEARSEPIKGQIAVAYSAVNRAVNKTVCDVVLAPKQYSIFNGNTFLKNVALSPNLLPKQKNKIDVQSWNIAMEVAHNVLAKNVPDPTNGATHYIADKVMKIKGYVYPRWSKQYTEVAVIANHRFFKPYYPRKKKAL